jgi:CrcB protein
LRALVWRQVMDSSVVNGEAGAQPAAVAAPAWRRNVAAVRVAAILAGGLLGTLTRAGLAEAFPHRGGEWPWATFAVNLAGTLLLAWLTTRLAERVAPSRYWRFFIGVGFCGALTTFSTFQVETIRLAKDGHAVVAVAYAAASLGCGMACAIAATVLARRGRYG